MRSIIDISRPIDDSLPVWKGRKRPSMEWASWIGKGDHTNATSICMSAHSGTHADAPLHFSANGASLEEIPLEVFVGECVVADVSDREPCEMDIPLARAYVGAKRLLIRTRHSYEAGSAGYSPHGRLMSLEAASILTKGGLVLLGTDRLSPDDSEGNDFCLHQVLLGAGCVIVEGLSLAHVEPKVYMLFAPPLNLGRREAGPARALLIPLEGREVEQGESDDTTK